MHAVDASKIVVVVLGLTASWTDLRTRRIPNAVTFGGAAAALVYALVMHGTSGLLVSTGGWLAGVILFLPFFLLGGMGAGDIKLIACFGAWLGPYAVLWVALYAALAGGVMAVVIALWTGYFHEAVLNLQQLLAFWRTTGLKPHPDLTLARARGPRLPYAVPIAAGAVLAMWLR